MINFFTLSKGKVPYYRLVPNSDQREISAVFRATYREKKILYSFFAEKTNETKIVTVKQKLAEIIEKKVFRQVKIF